MSDQERYIEFLESIGFTNAVGGSLGHREFNCLRFTGGVQVVLDCGDGYSGFYHWISFDDFGKFIGHGAAE